MIKKIFAFMAGHFMLYAAGAQPATHDTKPVKGRNHDVSLQLKYPFGGYLKDISNFATGIDYAWSRGRLGRLASRPSRPVGFIFNAGIDYFFGKKEKYGTYTVKYKGTTYLHAFAGAIYNVCLTGQISLTAGPAAEWYAGHAELGFGVNLSGGIYPFRCGNYGIGLHLALMKLGKSEAVFAGGVKLNVSF